jgi:hypothetical protein
MSDPVSTSPHRSDDALQDVDQIAVATIGTTPRSAYSAHSHAAPGMA